MEDVWPTVIRLPIYGITVQGASRASNRTGFYIPELKCFLDAGIQSMQPGRVVLVTHCHADHSFALPMLLMNQQNDICAYVPSAHVDLYQNFVTSSVRLAIGQDRNKWPWTIKGVGNNICIEINGLWFVKAYALSHNVPCMGYGLFKTQRQHRLDYTRVFEIHATDDLPSAYDENVPVLAYITDTTIDALEANLDIAKFNNVMIECTYFAPEDVNQAKEEKHMHWNDLRLWIANHPKTTFYLIHFSGKYSRDDIFRFFVYQKVYYKNVNAII